MINVYSKKLNEIEVFVNKQKICNTISSFIIDELQESWQTYQILLELLTKWKSHLDIYIIKKHNLWNQKFNIIMFSCFMLKLGNVGDLASI